MSISKIPQFDEENFSTWKKQAMVALETMDYSMLDIFMNGPQDKHFTTLDVRARVAIGDSLPYNVYRLVQNCTSAKEMMDTLTNQYGGTDEIDEISEKTKTKELQPLAENLPSHKESEALNKESMEESSIDESLAIHSKENIARPVAENKDDEKNFNFESTDDSARDFKVKVDGKDSYELKYKRLVAYLKRQNLESLVRAAEEEERVEEEESSEDCEKNLTLCIVTAEDFLSAGESLDQQTEKLKMINEKNITQRSSPHQIVKVRCTKPQAENIVTIHITRQVNSQQIQERFLLPELINFGYTEWLEMQKITKNHQGVHVQSLKMTLDTLINKVKDHLVLKSSTTYQQPVAVFSRNHADNSGQSLNLHNQLEPTPAQTEGELKKNNAKIMGEL